jgi:hypothetical protein
LPVDIATFICTRFSALHWPEWMMLGMAVFCVKQKGTDNRAWQ